jgi:hypothetical protein
MNGSPLCLLGPQRLMPMVREVLPALGVPADAPIATITAGWQEREADDQELDEHLGGRTVNLALYRRAEAVFAHDRELSLAVHARQETLRHLRAIYRLRIGHAIAGIGELLVREAGDAMVRSEREHAIEQAREIDRRHLVRVREVHVEFDQRIRPGEREAVVRARGEIEGALDSAAAVAVAGGHVAVLLNRLRLFGLAPLLATRPVVAWSAGAMALAERVVIFHDDPPEGTGNAEALENGLGLVHGVLPFPHAKRRLHLDDRARVLAVARRFAPASCVPMDEGARLDWDGAAWHPQPGTRRLGIEGAVETWSAA